MMTPTLVLGEEGEPRLVAGSAGSVRLAGAIRLAIETCHVLEGDIDWARTILATVVLITPAGATILFLHGKGGDASEWESDALRALREIALALRVR